MCIRDRPEGAPNLARYCHYACTCARSNLSVLPRWGASGCQAGVRFLVVRPDGMINACSMFPDRRYRTREDAVNSFKERFTCDQCYVSIRALTERSVTELAVGSIKQYVQMG